jgi:hypothetical protein
LGDGTARKQPGSEKAWADGIVDLASQPKIQQARVL